MATSEKTVNYKGTPIRLSTNFSEETLQARREWNDIFKVANDKTASQECSIWQLSFRYGEIKISSRPAEGVHHHYTCPANI